MAAGAVMAAAARPPAADAVEDQGLVHREAAHVVEQAGERQLLVRPRVARQLGALERVGQLGDALGPVAARGGVGHRIEEAIGHAGERSRHVDLEYTRPAVARS